MNRGREGSVVLMVELAIVAVLVGVSLFWYYQPHRSDTIRQTSNASDTQSNSQEFVIPEWGVQFQLPQDMKDLTYSVNMERGIASFSTQELQDIDPNCSPVNYPIGTLGRSTYDPATFVSSSPPVDQIIEGYEYDFIERNSGSCSTNTTAVALAIHQQMELENAISQTLQPVTAP